MIDQAPDGPPLVADAPSAGPEGSGSGRRLEKLRAGCEEIHFRIPHLSRLSEQWESLAEGAPLLSEGAWRHALAKTLLLEDVVPAPRQVR